MDSIHQARLAQSVEHQTLNRRVVGSSPTVDKKFFILYFVASDALLAGRLAPCKWNQAWRPSELYMCTEREKVDFKSREVNCLKECALAALSGLIIVPSIHVCIIVLMFVQDISKRHYVHHNSANCHAPLHMLSIKPRYGDPGIDLQSSCPIARHKETKIQQPDTTSLSRDWPTEQWSRIWFD